jgi:hypothetical protein
MAEGANRALTALEQAFVNSAPTAPSQAARKAAILRGIYANTGGPRLEYRGRNAMNRGVLQGMGEVAKYGAIVSALPAEVQREVEDAIAQAVGEDPTCELPSVEELGEAMAAFQIAERETAEEAALPGAAEAAAMKEGGGLGGAGNGNGNGNGRRNGRRNSRRAGRRSLRTQRGGAIGDFFRAFFRLTCGRTAVVAQQELAQRGRQGAVAAAVAQIENDNPAYIEGVRARWRTQLRERIAQALLAGAAVDLAGPQYTVWAVTSLLTMLSSFIPNITLYGAAAGVLTGAGAIVAAATPVALSALNAYLGVSLMRATLKRGVRGAQAARGATLAGALIAARDAIRSGRAATHEQIMDAVDDVVLSWLRFVSDVLFFGNDELLFRILGIQTREEKAESRRIIAEIRAQGARNAAAFEAAVAAQVHPSRRFRIMQQAAEDEAARAIAQRLATQSREIQTNAPVVVGGVNAGVGPNAAPGAGRAGFMEPRGRARAGSSAAAGSRSAAAAAMGVGVGGEEELNENGNLAAIGAMGAIGAAEAAEIEALRAELKREIESRYYEEFGAGGVGDINAWLVSKGKSYGGLKPADKYRTALIWIRQAPKRGRGNENNGNGAGGAAAAPAARQASGSKKGKRAGSVAKGSGGKRRENTQMGGARRRRTARKSRKAHKGCKHTRKH